VKELPRNDWPREKLARVGRTALGDVELVALLLGSGTPQQDALEVAQAVLRHCDGVQGLQRVSPDELRRIPGVGPARAARLCAGIELGRRTVQAQAGVRPQFRTPEDLARYLLPLHGGYRVEHFGAVLLDIRFRLIRTAILSVGTLDGALAQPREVFREALLASASRVVIFHNHPSGDPDPSQDDVLVTRRMMEAGEAMGIPVMDHIILGAGRYYSFKAGNLLG
jgi:DNA repair protein RadC